MTHRRTLLRQAFVARLIDATMAQERVYSGCLMPINDEEEEPTLPAIIVHTRQPEEVLERSTSGWAGFELRRCIVSVVCVAQSFDDLDTDLDEMADGVEARLQSWVIPGFESSDALLLDTRSDDLEFNGSLTTGSTVLRYGVNYRTPYRACSNPYVDQNAENIMRSGAYPGGRVTPGCPAGNTGEACPIGPAELFSNQEPIS